MTRLTETVGSRLQNLRQHGNQNLPVGIGSTGFVANNHVVSYTLYPENIHQQKNSRFSLVAEIANISLAN